MISDAARALARKIKAETGSDLILYNGPIDNDGYSDLFDCVAEMQQERSAVLLIVTNGGYAGAAYRIARLLQSSFDDFALFPPNYCKSAGTLIAVGASRLVVAPTSELGPLDVQLLKRDELGERKSGILTTSAVQSLNRHAFSLFEHFLLQIKNKSSGLVTFETSARLASNVTGAAFSGLYSQLNPNNLGEDHRDTMVAWHYGVRLAGQGGNTTPEMVYHLVWHYPSHDFIIDYMEIRGMFQNVDYPSDDMYKLLGELRELAAEEQDEPLVDWLSRPTATGPAQVASGGESESEQHDGCAEGGANPGSEPERGQGQLEASRPSAQPDGEEPSRPRGKRHPPRGSEAG